MGRRSRLRRAAGAAVLLGAALGVSVSSVARAEGDDTVYLKKGGVVRGIVMEYDPGGEARIKLADGSVRTIEASLIARVVMASDRRDAQPPASPPPAPAAAPAPVKEEREDRTAFLHVEGSHEVEIVGRSNDGYEWAPVCQAPCDRPVHLDWEYMARGTGIRPSAPFQLRGSDGQHLAVAVDPGSTTWVVLGVIGAIGGSSITLIGLATMGVGALAQSANDMTMTSSSSQSASNAAGSILTAGAVITTVGVVLLVGGGVAALSNWSTHVSQVGGGQDALPVPRHPAWYVAEGRATWPAVPPVYETPLLDVTF